MPHSTEDSLTLSALPPDLGPAGPAARSRRAPAHLRPRAGAARDPWGPAVGSRAPGAAAALGLGLMALPLPLLADGADAFAPRLLLMAALVGLPALGLALAHAWAGGPRR
jgi:hypothetical protein